jgi:hypothetical protein
MPEPDETEILAADLNSKQSKAIAALLEEPTIAKAAAAAGVAQATLYRWLHEPAFHRAYMHARWKTVQQSIARVQSFTSEAASVLRNIMNNTALPAYARVAAANSVLKNGQGGVELEDHHERLEQIQEDLAAIKPEK